MISDVKLPYYFLLSKVKNMFVALESFRKQYQSIKRKQPLRQKQSVTDVLQHGCFKNFVIFTGKHLCRSLFLIKLQVWRPETLYETPRPENLLKRNSNAGFFLWNLRNFLEHLFYRTPVVDAFDYVNVGKPLWLNTLHCNPPLFLVFIYILKFEI